MLDVTASRVRILKQPNSPMAAMSTEKGCDACHRPYRLQRSVALAPVAELPQVYRASSKP